MVEIAARYEGTLRCVARHGPSGVAITTDAPVDNQGKGASFSPTDLVATALLTCAMTTMGIVAQRMGFDVDGMTGEVRKGMAADPRRIAELPVVIALPGHLDDRQRELLEATARGCPVAVSLHPDIAAGMTFETT